MTVQRANKTHLDLLVPLFNAYRVYYKQPSNLDKAREFLSERIENEDSVIFIALDDDGAALGFTQLYPIFSSVSAQHIYVLNDIYVDSSRRGLGTGAALLNKAKEYATEKGAKRIELETDIGNPAQRLYERMGWVKDTKFYHFYWDV